MQLNTNDACLPGEFTEIMSVEHLAPGLTSHEHPINGDSLKLLILVRPRYSWYPQD